MARSPFTFLRGSANLMAYDLSSTRSTGLSVQLAGDAHLANFGMFATPEREPVFDVNDFDETLPGPWEWDLKRLATSFVVAGRENGLPRALCRRASRTAARAYRRAMARFASMRYLDVWYSHIDPVTSGLSLSQQSRRLIDRSAIRAHGRSGFHAFPKLVRAVRGGYRIRDAPPLLVHYKDPEAGLESRSSFARYLASLPDERRMLLERYHVVDVAQKVVGVGSVGTACSVLLLLADSDLQDPLFLQLKQASASALEPYLGPSPYENHAQRVVVGQHLVQEASDIFLGWSRLRSKDFYVRQLRDMTFAFEFDALGTKALAGHAGLCGTALARAHARTGDPAQISGYLGDSDAFDEAVTRFAETYAVQVARDHKALLTAIKRGRLPAKFGL
ncbi:MAG: DUF2252 domain-containing protein [Thermoplasmata archaeon]|nr:DUF2252 domain-containing protein [Thermoplasmata archaeon]